MNATDTSSATSPVTPSGSRTDTLTIARPDDWHLHLRDGAALQTVVPHTAAQFGRAIVLPNLRPPVTTAEQALAYKAVAKVRMDNAHYRSDIGAKGLKRGG